MTGLLVTLVVLQALSLLIQVAQYGQTQQQIDARTNVRRNALSELN